jgi:hypothetical protein
VSRDTTVGPSQTRQNVPDFANTTTFPPQKLELNHF